MEISREKNQSEEGKNKGITAVVKGTTWHIPLDPANRHYATIIEWAKEDSNEIAAAD